MRTKGVWAIVIICLWILGTIGGFWYTVYDQHWVIAPGVLANAILAFFKVRDIYNDSYNE
jgi:hypothetical protein